ncbi:MAG: hypothetical protein QXH16_08715 [Candidatus Bathyarchaeia archaeon]
MSRIRNGEEALTSSLVMDEVIMWLSRYGASRLSTSVSILAALTNMVVADPTLGNELEASEIYGRFPLGISDLINMSIMKE